MRSGKYYQGVKIDGIKHDVHRLIAEIKIGRKLESNEVVHHINEDKQDNRPENLEVMTRSEHAKLHSTGKIISEECRRKLSEKMKGKPHTYCRKLSESDILKILKFIDQGIAQRKIGKKFGVNHTVISNIVCGKSYREITNNLKS